MNWNHQLLKIFSGLLLFCLTTLAMGADTNAPAVKPAGGAGAVSLQEQAAMHERAGRKREAAVLYEELVRTDPVARKVLAGRLVTLYAEVGETNQALKWAHEVMRNNPDPQAYLAAVHARLGQFKQAQEILEHEISSNTNAARAVILRWQLAEVCDKIGDHQKARMLLEEGIRLAKSSPMEAVAKRKLDRVNQNEQ